SPSPSWGGWLSPKGRSRVGATLEANAARSIRPSPPGRCATTLPMKGREKQSLFGVPTRAELKRAALLSLITTALCLIWPLGALAQEAAQSGSAINIDLGTGAGLTQRV